MKRSFSAFSKGNLFLFSVYIIEHAVLKSLSEFAQFGGALMCFNISSVKFEYLESIGKCS